MIFSTKVLVSLIREEGEGEIGNKQGQRQTLYKVEQSRHAWRAGESQSSLIPKSLLIHTTVYLNSLQNRIRQLKPNSQHYSSVPYCTRLVAIRLSVRVRGAVGWSVGTGPVQIGTAQVRVPIGPLSFCQYISPNKFFTNCIGSLSYSGYQFPKKATASEQLLQMTRFLVRSDK